MTETCSYSDDVLHRIVDIANEIQPFMLAMVDTYSLASEEDVERVYAVYKNNLAMNIRIGFHSHDNHRNLFALARYFMSLSESEHEIVVDALLYGMGQGCGNLNTELLTEYLNRKGIKKYDMYPILDTIDTYLVKFKKEYKWGYPTPMLYAGLYGVHVYTTAYLESKPYVTSFDLKCMFEMLDEHKQKRYSYDYLDSIYEEFMK